ncbi:unnamed protein product [Paramecium pentaurelia]|uniref:Transmembrane protein n=1 Tax=Paramecium pentaurelia TaxID=43138 RepID=A0A8S1UKE1_9CILI|nr:unnamed protein product [Paramecium pentaurelia]
MIEGDEEDEINNHNEFYPIKSKIRNKQKVNKNTYGQFIHIFILVIFLAISILIFYNWIDNQSQEIQQSQLLPFQNPQDQNKLQCPFNTSFDSTTFTCLKCTQNCISCYHEYESRCLQCQSPFKLKQNICTKDCVSINNICVNTNNTKIDQINYTVIDLGTLLRVEQLFQVEIHTYSYKNIYIIFPPLGNSFNYFYQSLQLPELAKQLESTIFVFSTPYTEVIQIIENKDQQDDQFIYINRIYQFVQPYFLNQTKSINIVALGEMLFFAHKFATLIAHNLNQDFKIRLILMQTNEVELQESIQLEDQKLQNILKFINYKWNNNTHQEQDINFNEQNISQQLQSIKLKINIKKIINSVHIRRINVIIISERHSKDISILYQNGYNHYNLTQIFLDNNKWSAFFSKLQGLLL